MPRLEILHSNLILFALVVHITVGCCLRLLLVLKEGVVEHLIVNVDFAHFRLHAFSHFLLECFGLVGFGRLLPQFAYACLLYEVGQFERNFVDAPLVLKITSFLGPVPRYGHRVTYLFAFEEK